MMERIRSGRGVEEAVAAALDDLGVTRELCGVEVLEQASRGLLGLLAGREARVRVVVSAGKTDLAAWFLGETARRMGVDVGVETSQDDEDAVGIQLVGADAGGLIGHHGQTLDALQRLAEAFATARCEDRRRLTVDINGYRERRRRVIEEVARRAARQVRRLGRAIELDPMPAAERRIVHLALQGEPGVTTESTGEARERRVVVQPGD